MADFIFNIAKGRVNEIHDRVDANDPAASALIVVLLQTVESDALMKDRDDLAAILGANTEATFTNYARKTLTDANVTVSTTDDTNDRREADITVDPVWTAAGGATNNTLAKLIICYDADTGAGTDANIIPLTAHDFVITTNGGDLTAQVPATGYFRAT